MLFISKTEFGLRRVVRHFKKISITDILPDAESREEQDGANHFSILPRMAELWPNLCGDVGKKGEEGPFLLL